MAIAAPEPLRYTRLHACSPTSWGAAQVPADHVMRHPWASVLDIAVSGLKPAGRVPIDCQALLRYRTCTAYCFCHC